jgi:hypothetical protein
VEVLDETPGRPNGNGAFTQVGRSRTGIDPGTAYGGPPSIGPDGEFHFIGVFTDDQGASTWNDVEATPPVHRCEPVKQINSAGDGGDASPGDGSCDTGGTVDGEPECTLRAAIEESNAGSNLERIEFAPDVSWRRIDPGSALPPIASGLDLVGLPGMVIDGSGAGTSAVGLRVEAEGTTVSDLTLANFDSQASTLPRTCISSASARLEMVGSETSSMG